MRKLLVDTIQGKKEETVFNLNDFPFKHLDTCDLCKKGSHRKYYNVPSAFDIETTNVDGVKNAKGEYIVSPFAFMYHWQFCLDIFVIFGRTWEEFTEFFDKLSEECGGFTLCVYVHNLAFEYQFIKDFIEIENMFAKAKRRPMKFTSHKGAIEWRCSYFLSNMSLAKFCESSELCIHYKLLGQFDYNKIRTPFTPLNETEEGYCFNDVYGLCEDIRTLLQEDTIATIPLTSTGYVRREVREAMKKNPENRTIFEKTALTEEQYIMCKEAFRGGDTHANRMYAGKILLNIDSYDMTSAYPSSMELDLYPMSKFAKVEPKNDEEFYEMLDQYACLMRINFFNIECQHCAPSPYIPIAKCNKFRKPKNDNGRVLKAEYLNITLTELDFEIIENMYEYESFSIERMYIAKKDRLPYELREITFDYFKMKTELKGVEGQEYFYMKSKNRINSIFGMMVTAIDHAEIETDGHEWTERSCDIKKALEGYYKAPNSFLPYQWGVWVTAYARYRLNKMREKQRTRTAYNDTDSLKGINYNKEIFDKENKRIIQQCEENDIPLFAYNKKGEIQYMMVWDHDAHYERFKTLGAKKYVYDERNKKGELEFHITISGVDKKKGAERIGCVEYFDVAQLNKENAIGVMHDIGRKTSYYNEDVIHTMEINGEYFTTASNIAMIDSTYELGITDEYYNVLKNYFDISAICY